MDPWPIDKKMIGRNVVQYARLSFDRAFAAVEKHQDTGKLCMSHTLILLTIIFSHGADYMVKLG